MTTTPDPLHDALREATLAVLLGSTTVPHTSVGYDGTTLQQGTITIRSAFEDRLRSQAMAGEFDDLLRQAMAQVEVATVARALEGLLAEQFLEALKAVRDGWGNAAKAGWLQSQVKEISVEAIKAALAEDEGLKETLREKIGMEVDRNRISLSVNLADRESA